MAAICFHGRGTHTQPQYNTLIVLLSTYLCNLSTCCRLLQLRGGEPPQADYSAKKAIRHYRSVTSQIIMGGAPRAPAICRLVVIYYNCATASRRRLITLRRKQFSIIAWLLRRLSWVERHALPLKAKHFTTRHIHIFYVSP